ncbi:MAG: cyclic nucleotide-binding domain-containing protein [Rhodocyclaceae bacterium]|nr:cyclic nucleotide-binding domain-containing protein [Rhodocyclaceae bacterium]
MTATLLEKLSRCQPLASLGPDSLRELAPLCHSERVTRNLDPFLLRDWQGQVVYLMKGELKLDFADGSAALLVGGTGEALLPLGQRGATPVSAKAITDVELLRFDEDTLDILVTWDQLAAPGQGAAAATSDHTDWRTMSGMFAARNLTQGAFSALPPAHIETLLGRFQRVRVKRGETVIRQGAAGDYYYVIERGRCLVTREVGGSQVELAELKAGDAFGEEALVSDTTRNATVAMKTDGVLLRLSKTDFVDLLREPLMQRVSPGEARQRVAAGAVWLDVRFPAECHHDGLAGAINIPLNEVRQALPMLDPKKEYIVYCQTGRRSSAATFLLSQRGIHAVLLDGGLKALSATADGSSR